MNFITDIIVTIYTELTDPTQIGTVIAWVIIVGMITQARRISIYLKDKLVLLKKNIGIKTKTKKKNKSSFIQKWRRGNQLKHHLFIRKNRDNEVLINHLSIKASSWLILFVLSILFLWYLMVADLSGALNFKHWLITLIATLPIYIFEVKWLIATYKSEDLVKAHGLLMRYKKS